MAMTEQAPDQSAILWSEDEGWTMKVPNAVGTLSVPEVQALIGAYIRLSDDERFREECRALFAERINAAPVVSRH